VADHDYNAVSKRPADFKSLFYERGTNAKALEIRVHHKGSQGNSRRADFGGFDGNGRKHDMPDNPVTMDSDKGKFRIENLTIPQGIYKTCFVIVGKRLVVYLENSRNICRNFRPDKK
jgi:hypothetical protein